MLSAGIKLDGEFFVQNEAESKEVNDLFEHQFKRTRKKIDCFLEAVHTGKIQFTVADDGEIWQTNLIKNLEEVKAKRNSIFLGGYKGLFHNFKEQQNEFGALYVDTAVDLPYGLVTIKLK